MEDVKLEMARQTRAALVAFASRAAASLTDDAALKMAAAFPAWPSGVDDAGQYEKGQIVQHGGGLYRIEQPVAPQAHQPPDAEGMLAVYRPVSPSHAGTADDPIPWVFGMDCRAGQYFSYGDKLYLCKGDMLPCVWAPGSEGLWQWEEVTAEEPESEPEEPEGGGETEPDEPETGGETEEGGTDEPAEPSEPDGTLENPILFELNMNTEKGKYYSHEGKVYLCKADMSPCVWAPGTAGLWQWEEVSPSSEVM